MITTAYMRIARAATRAILPYCMKKWTVASALIQANLQATSGSATLEAFTANEHCVCVQVACDACSTSSHLRLRVNRVVVAPASESHEHQRTCGSLQSAQAHTRAASSLSVFHETVPGFPADAALAQLRCCASRGAL